MSQSPQTGQFNSYTTITISFTLKRELSQSPQTGQFNSYLILILLPLFWKESLNPLKRVNSILTWFWHLCIRTAEVEVSIPSNGSIQFLHCLVVVTDEINYEKSQSPQTGQFNSYSNLWINLGYGIECLNPLKRVNSILTVFYIYNKEVNLKSQSPQTGQFNSYNS